MLEVMAGTEPGDAYAPPPHDGAFVAACAEDPAPLRIGVCASRPSGVLDDEVAAIFDTALEVLTHMGHRLEEAEAAARGAHAAVRDDRARPDGGAAAASCRPSASTCSSPRRARRCRRRAHRRRRVRAGRRGGPRAARPRCSRRSRPTSSSSRPVLTRPAVPLDAFPSSAAARASCWRGLLRVALLHRALQRHGPAGALAALRQHGRAGCPVGPADRRAAGRRRARARARRRPRAGAGVTRWTPPIWASSRPPRCSPSARLSAAELTRACLARIRERDGAHSHEGDPASINAWVRVYEEEALGAAARVDEARARGAGPLPQLRGHPDRAQGSVRASRASR